MTASNKSHKTTHAKAISFSRVGGTKRHLVVGHSSAIRHGVSRGIKFTAVRTKAVSASRVRFVNAPPIGSIGRGGKEETLRFRVDPRQKQYWLEAIAKLGIEDFSTYARAAIERSITQDLRSQDPKWQEFIKSIQPQAKEILGTEISDNPKDRLENMDEINKVLERQRLKK